MSMTPFRIAAGNPDVPKNDGFIYNWPQSIKGTDGISRLYAVVVPNQPPYCKAEWAFKDKSFSLGLKAVTGYVSSNGEVFLIFQGLPSSSVDSFIFGKRTKNPATEKWEEVTGASTDIIEQWKNDGNLVVMSVSHHPILKQLAETIQGYLFSNAGFSILTDANQYQVEGKSIAIDNFFDYLQKQKDGTEFDYESPKVKELLNMGLWLDIIPDLVSVKTFIGVHGKLQLPGKFTDDSSGKFELDFNLSIDLAKTAQQQRKGKSAQEIAQEKIQAFTALYDSPELQTMMEIGKFSPKLKSSLLLSLVGVSVDFQAELIMYSVTEEIQSSNPKPLEAEIIVNEIPKSSTEDKLQTYYDVLVKEEYAFLFPNVTLPDSLEGFLEVFNIETYKPEIDGLYFQTLLDALELLKISELNPASRATKQRFQKMGFEKTELAQFTQKELETLVSKLSF